MREGSQGDVKRRSVLGVAAYLMVPGERRRRAAGHFSRAAMEAAKGVRALSVPARPAGKESKEENPGEGSPPGGRQRIDIE
jgi:hypothetical protein